jgi:hypothetical protein
MALQRSNITSNLKDKEKLVECVNVQLLSLPQSLPWTMIITQARSGVFSVRTVIEGSSDATDVRSGELKFSDEHHNT